MERLDCHVKEYAWGKCGEQSEVARLFSAGHQSFNIGSTTPYAELWMGTHPDGPAKVRASSECLSRVMARDSEGDLARYFLENDSCQKPREEVHLPFIMKIMSIKHTLSLQVHPTKEQAALLHRQDPLHYPDRNHKPELAYALTRFELLCGFRPAEQIVENMQAFPELSKVMGEKNCEKFISCFRTLNSTGEKNPSSSEELRVCLRKCFATMLQLQVDRPSFVEDQLKSLYRRIDENVRGCLIEDTIPVMRDTYRRFPKDVGCFAPLFVNHMILQPGECCYYAAEELHAYLSGECVECVGCSNNTIRAALTPKYIDRENLIRVLNYRMTDPSFYMVERRPLENEPKIVEFAPNDCTDFTLHEIQVPSTTANTAVDNNKEIVELPALECPSIIVIVEGEASCQETQSSAARNGSKVGKITAIKRGDIFYIPPRQTLRLKAKVGERFLAYRTFSYEQGPDHGSRIVVNASANSNVIGNGHHHPLNGNGTHTNGNGVHIQLPTKANGIQSLRKISALENKAPPAEIQVDDLKLKQKINGNGNHLALFVVESEMDGFL